MMISLEALSDVGMTCIGRIRMTAAQPVRVLVIDDDSSVREIVREVLTTFGYDCHTAADGRSGLVRFDEGGWDLVLTNLVMPEVSGWDVVKAIRRRAPSTPIIVLTGSTDSAVMQQASEWQVPVVSKPFSLQTLKVTLVDALYTKVVLPHWRGSPGD
jgi:CheY-like chemotaxis protein